MRKKKQSANETIRIHFEAKGRKGNGVTVISGLNMEKAELKITTKNLKKYCGVGGSCKNGLIEIQGDQRNKSRIFLKNLAIKIS
tara:strand:- start:665 stop:916 length:252 start_codon:yes stop_codon:yes gene_type:complete